MGRRSESPRTLIWANEAVSAQSPVSGQNFHPSVHLVGCWAPCCYPYMCCGWTEYQHNDQDLKGTPFHFSAVFWLWVDTTIAESHSCYRKRCFLNAQPAPFDSRQLAGQSSPSSPLTCRDGPCYRLSRTYLHPSTCRFLQKSWPSDFRPLSHKVFAYVLMRIPSCQDLRDKLTDLWVDPDHFIT